jgi:phosphoribosylpyrophosphate synthetase
MEELTRSNDPIRLSFLTHLLAEAGIEVVVLDQHTSQMFFGSLNGLEQRLMVAHEDLAQARRLMRDLEPMQVFADQGALEHPDLALNGPADGN